MTETSIKNRKILEKITLHIKNVQGDDDVESSNKVSIESIKQDVKEVIDYNRNTTTYSSDGSIVITPHYLENIPNEILDKIIGYLCDQQQSKQPILQKNLYQLTLVNKQFYQRTNYLLWRAPCISNTSAVDRFLTCLANTHIIQQKTTPSYGLNNGKHHPVLFDILISKHHIRRLDISGEFWDNIQFTAMMPYLGLLETLNIKNEICVSTMTDVFLRHLPRYCPHIISLSLGPAIIKESTCLGVIAQHCYQLRKLEISLHTNSQQLNDDILQSIVTCSSLTILHLIGKSAFARGRCLLTESMILNLSKLHQLKTLSFIGNNMIPTIDVLLRTIDTTTTWPLLSSLRIDCGDSLTDSFMIPFIESHPHIKSLDLSSTRFSDSTLESISTRLAGITHVRFVSNGTITAEGVYKLVRYCRYLKKADFTWCCNLVHAMTEFSHLPLDGEAILTLAQMNNIRQRDNNN